jgi:dTMP kinase
MENGKFITLEGGEGSGKSTQIKLLAEKLKALGKETLLTREPGGSPGAEQIRKLLVEGDVAKWDGETEVLLHYAARRDHLVKTVWPALKTGRWVISDRFADSTAAYQGYGHGLDSSFIQGIQKTAIGDFQPDCTLILDIPIETGLLRAFGREGGEDRYERMGEGFHNRLRQGFLEIADKAPGRCTIIDATGDIASVEVAIWQAVSAKFGLAP